MANYCLECGGVLSYDPKLRQYACRSCGVTYTHQQLLDARESMRVPESSEEERRRKQKEYLKWWLSKKG